MYRGLGADAFVLPADSMTSTPDPSITNQDAVNAYINAGGSDTSARVDTSTGLPLYVASPSRKSTTTISPMLLAGGAGLLLLLVVMGGRRR